MDSSGLKEIEKIPFPEGCNPLFKKLPSLLVQGMKKDFSSVVELGAINLGKLDEELKVLYFFFVWIEESNEVIENLNLTLLDLRELPNRYWLLSGSPRKRFCLLVRLYFYEFYRFKERFDKATKTFYAGGNFNKVYLLEIQKFFYDAFKHAIEIRNSLVHGSPLWRGKRYIDLTLIDCLEKFGLMTKEKETGKILHIADVLKDICEPMADELQDIGNAMSSVLKDITHGFYDLSIRKG